MLRTGDYCEDGSAASCLIRSWKAGLQQQVKRVIIRPEIAGIHDLPMKLDRIDLKILYELQKNGRITNVELAELVHLSPSPCLMRVKKLQAEGFITGYSAQIDVSRLGQTLTVFTEITLKNHRQIDFARFLATVEKIDSVIECHLVSGGYDYLMKFVTAGIVEYQTIMERLIDMDVGIDKYFSFVVLKSPIVKTHLPLDTMFEK
jgi:DNA-binding Lrp family transcriptional regulator